MNANKTERPHGIWMKLTSVEKLALKELSERERLSQAAVVRRLIMAARKAMAPEPPS